MKDMDVGRTATSRQFAPSKIANKPSDYDHDYADEQVRRAGRYLEAGRIDLAEACLRSGLERAPDHAECTAYLGVCLAAGQRKYVTAEKLVKNILASNPYDPTAWYALGRINLLGGRREQAFRNFAKAKQVSRDDAGVEKMVDQMDPRRPPVLTFLPRNNPLNVWLGRLRSHFSSE